MVESKQPRLQHLLTLEKQMKELFAKENIYESDAAEDYSQLSFEEKNAGKYMCTFPVPYMNGYLHLGKCNNFDVFRSRLLHVKM